MAVREPTSRVLEQMAKYNAHGAARVNLDVYKIGSNQGLIVLVHRSSNPKQIEVAKALHMEVDRDSVDICHE